MTWDTFYNFFGIKDFIYFISSSQIQDMLFPIKMIFVIFSVFFLVLVIYFMLNSSWLQNKFLDDVGEFFHWQAYGERQAVKQWDKIKKRIELRAEQKLLETTEKTEKIIREVIPKDAEITAVLFDQQRSIVVIEAKKPGLVIGREGGLLKDIKQKTFCDSLFCRAGC